MSNKDLPTRDEFRSSVAWLLDEYGPVIRESWLKMLRTSLRSGEEEMAFEDLVVALNTNETRISLEAIEKAERLIYHLRVGDRARKEFREMVERSKDFDNH